MSDTNPRHFIVVAITDTDEVKIVGSYRNEQTARDSATLTKGHVLDIEFEIEHSPYGKGVIHFAEWLD